MRKAEEGKATRDHGRSYNGPAKRGLLLSLSSVFYRESLTRLLALERYRNLIETNIAAGITLYTDHKPGLYENSLSNKGQLSAWRLLETTDLLSIVENLYRTGGKTLLADPLSRLCAPGDGFTMSHCRVKLGCFFRTCHSKWRNVTP